MRVLYLNERDASIVRSALDLYLSMQQGQGPDNQDEVDSTKRILKRLDWEDLGWTEELAIAAEAEGWCIADTGGLLQLQRVDEADVFDDDFEAIGYVVSKAEEGSELHGIALGITLCPKWHNSQPCAGRPRSEVTRLANRQATPA